MVDKSGQFLLFGMHSVKEYHRRDRYHAQLRLEQKEIKIQTKMLTNMIHFFIDKLITN